MCYITLLIGVLTLSLCSTVVGQKISQQSVASNTKRPSAKAQVHRKNVKPEGHAFSVIRFSYDDNSPIGPHSWDNTSIVHDASTHEQGFDEEIYNTNSCHDQWFTPLNIDTRSVVAPEVKDQDDDGERPEKVDRSLIIFLTENSLEQTIWEFGHPMDAYHGLEVRSASFGQFQLSDRFDFIAQGLGWTGVNEFTNYDFAYASIFYCDPDKAHSSRSMHQIDGKRFPFEIEFVFFNQPPKIGYDRFVCRDKNDEICKTVGVILTVLGEFSDNDNPRLQPLINTAKKYEGPGFEANDEDEGYKIPIKGPWSPTWLIPDLSSYYYYDSGTFPVPPCWYVARIYVIKETIKISRKQLNVLTNIRTSREPTTQNKLPCTYSKLRKHTGDDLVEIRYNDYPLIIRGEDKRPFIEGEIKNKKEKLKRLEEFDKNEKVRKKGLTFSESFAMKYLPNNLQLVFSIIFNSVMVVLYDYLLF